MISQTRSTPIDMKDVLKYELTPMPLSLFKTDDAPIICKSKSVLKAILQVDVNTRTTSPDFSILDGCAILWIIHWPSNGTLQNYITSLCKYVMDHLFKHATSIIFDRYYDFSIKSVTREARNVTQSSKQVKLVLNGPLPPKNVVLTNKNNKKQLIRFLVDALIKMQLPNSNKKLLVTGPDPVPIEVRIDGLKRREDLKTFHEEADTIIVSQMLSMVEAGYRQIEIENDDTDCL